MSRKHESDDQEEKSGGGLDALRALLRFSFNPPSAFAYVIHSCFLLSSNI